MSERFNSRVRWEIIGIIVNSHKGIETLLIEYDVAYNGRRQRASKELSLEMVLRQRLKAKPDLASPPSRPSDSSAIERPCEIVSIVNEVSKPNSLAARQDLFAAQWHRPNSAVLELVHIDLLRKNSI